MWGSFVGSNIERMGVTRSNDGKYIYSEKIHNNRLGDFNTAEAKIYQRDIVEISLQDVMQVLPPENYNNFEKIMPKINFKDMRAKVNEKLTEYFSNPERNVEELKAFYKEICLSRKIFGLQDGYDFLLNSSVMSAYDACRLEGEKIAEGYNYGKDTDYTYYNADYHYALEEAKDILKAVVSELADEHKLPKVDFNGTESRRLLMAGRNYSFNETWEMYNSQLANRCTILDTSISPPKGFKLFYIKHSEKKEINYSEIQSETYKKYIEKWSHKVDIAWDNALSLDKILTSKGDKFTSYIEEANIFIKNFDFYIQSNYSLYIKIKSNVV